MVEGEHGDKPRVRWELRHLPVSVYTSSISNNTRPFNTDDSSSADDTEQVFKPPHNRDDANLIQSLKI